MIRLISTILISVATFFTLNAIIPTANEVEIYDSCVRLHVIANSDSEGDQELKLKVRDALLDKMNENKKNSKQEALKWLEENKKMLEEISSEEISKNGYTYDAKIEIGIEEYPTRNYEDFSLPAGKYTSVRVIIGEGKGQNWWCVLYPPLCNQGAISYDEDAYIDVGLTKDQYGLITQSSGKYKVKFKLLEVASEIVGFEY
jgi:stage II sporulation protein R